LCLVVWTAPALVGSMPQGGSGFNLSMFEPFLESPEIVQELGSLVADQIRSAKPSDLVRAGLGVNDNTTVNFVDDVPGANIGKDVVAGGVELVAKRPSLVKMLFGFAQNPPKLIDRSLALARRVATLVLTDE